MTSKRDRRPEEVPEAAVEPLLARAAELDAVRRSTVPIARLREVALEAGIQPEAFDAALGEAESHVARLSPDETSTRQVQSSAARKAPAWVRFCMFGVPDRRTAMVFYWVFGTALGASPFLTLWFDLDRLTAFAVLGFSVFALWSTSRAIRWLDQHGWDTLE